MYFIQPPGTDGIFAPPTNSNSYKTIFQWIWEIFSRRPLTTRRSAVNNPSLLTHPATATEKPKHKRCTCTTQEERGLVTLFLPVLSLDRAIGEGRGPISNFSFCWKLSLLLPSFLPPPPQCIIISSQPGCMGRGGTCCSSAPYRHLDEGRRGADRTTNDFH